MISLVSKKMEVVLCVGSCVTNVELRKPHSTDRSEFLLAMDGGKFSVYCGT